MPTIQDLIQDLITKEAQADLLATQIRELRDQIVSLDFDKVTTETHSVTKAKKTFYSLRQDAQIPAEYMSVTFNQSAMQKKEPSTRSRILKGLMQDYPEYQIEQIDTAGLQKDHIELFDKKETPYITLKKI